jgi:hypothetical protein
VIKKEEAIAPLEGCKIQTHYGVCSASIKKKKGDWIPLVRDLIQKELA